MFFFTSFAICSTSLPGGNQVDGLPPVPNQIIGTGDPRGAATFCNFVIF